MTFAVPDGLTPLKATAKARRIEVLATRGNITASCEFCHSFPNGFRRCSLSAIPQPQQKAPLLLPLSGFLGGLAAARSSSSSPRSQLTSPPHSSTRQKSGMVRKKCTPLLTGSPQGLQSDVNSENADLCLKNPLAWKGAGGRGIDDFTSRSCEPGAFDPVGRAGIRCCGGKEEGEQLDDGGCFT